MGAGSGPALNSMQLHPVSELPDAPYKLRTERHFHSPAHQSLLVAAMIAALAVAPCRPSLLARPAARRPAARRAQVTPRAFGPMEIAQVRRVGCQAALSRRRRRRRLPCTAAESQPSLRPASQPHCSWLPTLQRRPPAPWMHPSGLSWSVSGRRRVGHTWHRGFRRHDVSLRDASRVAVCSAASVCEHTQLTMYL